MCLEFFSDAIEIASRKTLRTFFNAFFNSKHISSSKDFSKKLLKALNGPKMDRAAILIFSNVETYKKYSTPQIFCFPMRALVARPNNRVTILENLAIV